MAANRRKKNSRQRGSHTHGWGAKKKHRGAGHRGGRGRAGSGKRADQKKPSIFKEFGNTYFGKWGFRIPQKKIKHIKCINVGELCKKIESFGFKRDGEHYIVSGFDKILGGGDVNVKLRVSCAVSKRAAEKIRSAGGEMSESE